MEFRGVYVIWFFLPLWYVILTFWTYARPLFKVSGKEKPGRYLPSLFYTGICFAIAIVIDQFGIAEAFVEFLEGTGFFPSDLQPGILRFLIYPAVLVFAAQAQKIINREDDERKRNLPKAKWR